MPADLTTTNTLLGILAAVGVLEALGLIALVAAGYVLFRRLLAVLEGIEARQIVPVTTRVNAILDDVQEVTASVKSGVDRVDSSLGWVVRLLGRRLGI